MASIKRKFGLQFKSSTTSSQELPPLPRQRDRSQSELMRRSVRLVAPLTGEDYLNNSQVYDTEKYLAQLESLMESGKENQNNKNPPAPMSRSKRSSSFTLCKEKVKKMLSGSTPFSSSNSTASEPQLRQPFQVDATKYPRRRPRRRSVNLSKPKEVQETKEEPAVRDGTFDTKPIAPMEVVEAVAVLPENPTEVDDMIEKESLQKILESFFPSREAISDAFDAACASPIKSPNQTPGCPRKRMSTKISSSPFEPKASNARPPKPWSPPSWSLFVGQDQQEPQPDPAYLALLRAQILESNGSS